jgi:hypothetical protein
MSERDTVRVSIAPEIAALAQQEARRGVRWRNAPVVALGLFGLLAGILFFLDPSSVKESPIGSNLRGPGDEVWTAAMLVGGLLVVVGALRPWTLVELCGWAIYVPGLVAYVVAVIVVLKGTPPALFYGLAIAVAGCAKMVYLLAYAPRTVVRLDRRSPGGAFEGEDRRSGP